MSSRSEHQEGTGFRSEGGQGGRVADICSPRSSWPLPLQTTATTVCSRDKQKEPDVKVRAGLEWRSRASQSWLVPDVSSLGKVTGPALVSVPTALGRGDTQEGLTRWISGTDWSYQGSGGGGEKRLHGKIWNHPVPGREGRAVLSKQG